MAEEKKELKIKKIVIDRDLCIGAGTCVVLAPQTFEMDDENIAVLIDEKGNTAEEILMGAESCPTKAILLYGEDDEQIYP